MIVKWFTMQRTCVRVLDPFPQRLPRNHVHEAPTERVVPELQGTPDRHERRLARDHLVDHLPKDPVKEEAKAKTEADLGEKAEIKVRVGPLPTVNTKDQKVERNLPRIKKEYATSSRTRANAVKVLRVITPMKRTREIKVKERLRRLHGHKG